MSDKVYEKNRSNIILVIDIYVRTGAITFDPFGGKEIRLLMDRKLRDKYNSLISNYVKKKLYLNTYMNLTDNTHLELENCKKILEYNDIYVKIRTSTMIVSIWGQNIRISDYNTDGIIVDGVFSSVEFEKLK